MSQISKVPAEENSEITKGLMSFSAAQTYLQVSTDLQDFSAHLFLSGTTQ